MSIASDKINVGVIGLGHWGPNIVRNFYNHPQVRLTYVCDVSEAAFSRVGDLVSKECQRTTDASQVINSSDVDAVAIVTPASTHYELVKSALLANKHVYCEKPLTLNAEQDKELCVLAERAQRKLVVGYGFLFNNSIRKVKELIDENRLGRIYYLTATRTHMGLIRKDVSVVWDLAPHDVSIMNYLLDATPERVSAVGSSPLGLDKPDLAFIHLFYPGGIVGKIHVSWVDSNKERVVRIIGSKASILFDDLNNLEPVRLYEKGVGFEDRIEADFGEFKLLLRDGDIISPKIKSQEPLKNMIDAFIHMILGGDMKNITDGSMASKVGCSIQAVHRSIKNGGTPETVIY